MFKKAFCQELLKRDDKHLWLLNDPTHHKAWEYHDFFAWKARRHTWFWDTSIPTIHGRRASAYSWSHLSVIRRTGWMLIQSRLSTNFINRRTFGAIFTLSFCNLFLPSLILFMQAYLLSHLRWILPVFTLTSFTFLLIGFFKLFFKLVRAPF